MNYSFKHNIQAEAYKAISLFAGAGGCSLGFARYGVRILGAYDIWPVAVETYNHNFGGHKARQVDLSCCDFNQIRQSLNIERGALDLVIGGPPCQGFSTAGKRSEKDARNRLLGNYAAALSVFYPRWFMMENVEGMLTTCNGDFIVDCVQQMISLGYTVYIKKVYMNECGVPQHRKRVIIVGNREGKSFLFPTMRPRSAAFPLGHKEATLFEAIGDLEGIDIPQLNHVRKEEEGIKLQRIMALKEGGTMRDLPPELQHESYARRAARRVCDGTPSEKRGGAPSGIKRLTYAAPSPTITGAATCEFVHPREDRMLTIRECARIQTFPDTFLFAGSDTQQGQQIGNAIPPRFANQMAEQIFTCDRQPSLALPRGLQYYDVTKATAKSPALDATCRRLDSFTQNLFPL